MGSPKEIEALTRGGPTGNEDLGPVTWVSAGGIHSAAVVGKNVYTWGGSSYGQVRAGWCTRLTCLSFSLRRVIYT